jgi:hypothetical protein
VIIFIKNDFNTNQNRFFEFSNKSYIIDNSSKLIALSLKLKGDVENVGQSKVLI